MNTTTQIKIDLQQALLVCLQFPVGVLEDENKLDAVYYFEDILIDVIEKTHVGQFDGNEFCEAPDEESVTFFMYGPDANKMYETIEPVLSYLPSLPGSYVIKCYGDPHEQDEEIPLR